MARTREIWDARLAGLAGMGLRETPESKGDPDGPAETAYLVYIRISLDRDPNRQVYLNMTTAEARRLIESLQRSTAHAETENDKRAKRAQ